MDDPSSGYHGADPTVLQSEGFNLARQAVEHDTAQQFELAAFYYTVGLLIFIMSNNSSIQ